MSRYSEYLSDEELEKLISEAESDMHLAAPPDLSDNVMEAIEASERKKVVSFSWYCLRAGFAVAAAIALICVVPLIPVAKQEIPSKEAVLSEKHVASRQEVINSKAVKTKEEVLREVDKKKINLEETENYIRSYFDGLFY